MRVIAHFDGGCRSKHAIAGAGAVVYDEVGTELAARAAFLAGEHVTTPIAEYTALTLALHLARELGATEVVAWGDAELIVRHVDGRYRCRSETLQPLLAYVHRLQELFDSAEVKEFPKAGPQHKRRWANERADELANMAMDARSSIKVTRGRR